MTPTNLEELKRAAEAATPGEWRRGADGVAICLNYGTDADYTKNGWAVKVAKVEPSSAIPPEQAFDNAGFIALANPSTILALISENDRLRSELEAERERNEWRPIDEKSTFIEWLRSWAHGRDDKWITHRTARLAYEEFDAARAHFQSQEASDGE